MPEGGIIAKNNRSMRTLGAKLKEIRDELFSFSQIDPTKAWNSHSAMYMNVEECELRFVGPRNSFEHGIGA